jgi:hypothetical protein
MVEGAFACVLLFFFGLFGLLFSLQRRLYRKRKSGFYPTSRSLGDALETLQIFAQPRIAYIQQVKEKKLAEDDENGDGSPEGAA